ncbi:MAG TPA: CHAT domain-containing protein [Thermoanaerobaculia bacterium]|nr:CHAT domain-containing protein [Thermoanaerobaculia bacterium]
MTPSEAPAPDLEMRVRTIPENGKTRLHYTLHSPSGKAPFFHREIAGPLIQGSPEEYHGQLLEKFGKLSERLDVDGSQLLRAEIERKLTALGYQLWRELFLPNLLDAYREARRSEVKTWLLISDEPWIPWELIKPFDASRKDEVINDDFLALRFELTRWLSGDKVPASAIGVRHLAAIRTTEDLPQSGDELSFLSDLSSRMGIEPMMQAPVSADDLLGFLESGNAEALHFLGHGVFQVERADDSTIPLPDGSTFRPSDLEGPLADRIGQAKPLVVLNACWGAQQGWSLTRIGGWAAHWVGVAGCGAFIAPLWPVRDKVALAFTQGFYGALAQGATLGHAGLKARQHLRETQPGDPSALAYVVYGHPNARVLFGESAPAAQDSDIANAPPAIREKIRSFDLLIARKTEGFVGRQWLFDAIDGFTQKETRGYVQILGDPGIGKTTLIAEMVKRHRHPHHFNIRAEGIQKPDQFLPSLCAQLVARFGLGTSNLPPEVSRDASFLVNLLEKAAAKLKPNGQKLLVLVDALDESDPTAVTRGSNTLYLPSDLPDNTFFVVTSRRGGPPLRYACAEHKIDLQKETENNFADVRLFAQSWLGRDGIQAYVRTQGLKDTDFVEEIVRLSEGNFMYLHYVLPEIEKGTYRERKFDTLPSGLENYYEDHWQRMKEGDENAWFDYKLPVLVALTIAKEPISLNLIRDFSRVERDSRVQAVVDEWAPFLQPLEVEEEGEREIRWRLYHESFFDFITRKDQVEAERVDLKKAHGQAADVLWQTLYPEG